MVHDSVCRNSTNYPFTRYISDHCLDVSLYEATSAIQHKYCAWPSESHSLLVACHRCKRQLAFLWLVPRRALSPRMPDSCTLFVCHHSCSTLPIRSSHAKPLTTLRVDWKPGQTPSREPPTSLHLLDQISDLAMPNPPYHTHKSRRDSNPCLRLQPVFSAPKIQPRWCMASFFCYQPRPSLSSRQLYRRE